MEIGTRVIVRSNEDEPIVIGRVIGDAKDHGLKCSAPVVRVEGSDKDLICFGIVVPYHEGLFEILKKIDSPKDQWDFMVTYSRRMRDNTLPPKIIKTICMHCKKVLVEGPNEPVSHGICDYCLDKHYPI